MIRLGCNIEYNAENGKQITRINRTNHFCLPQKQRIVSDDGTITIDHKYKDGLHVIKSGKNGRFKVLLIEHTKLLNPLFSDNPEFRMDNNGVKLTSQTLEIFKALPTTLKRTCKKYIEKLTSEANMITGRITLSDIKTYFSKYMISANTPVIIMETKRKGSTEKDAYKKTIIHSNGTVIVHHKYASGLYTCREIINGKNEYTLITKNGVTLYNKYLPTSGHKLIGLPMYTNAIAEAFESLPEHLKRICEKNVKQLLKK